MEDGRPDRRGRLIFLALALSGGSLIVLGLGIADIVTGHGTCISFGMAPSPCSFLLLWLGNPLAWVGYLLAGVGAYLATSSARTIYRIGRRSDSTEGKDSGLVR
jgi:hypothetical protein